MYPKSKPHLNSPTFHLLTDTKLFLNGDSVLFLPHDDKLERFLDCKRFSVFYHQIGKIKMSIFRNNFSMFCYTSCPSDFSMFYAHYQRQRLVQVMALFFALARPSQHVFLIPHNKVSVTANTYSTAYTLLIGTNYWLMCQDTSPTALA